MSQQTSRSFALLLERFFSAMPVEIPGPAGAILAPIWDVRAELVRQDCLVTLFGAVKTGKTSLLNRLLGAGVLPEHARRTGSWVTTVTYGPAPEAVLVMRDGTERHLPFDEVRRIWPGWDEEGICEVRVTVPLAILGGGMTLVDTPGLLVDEAATETAYRTLERTDLAVMVLAADKILSSEERDSAAYVHNLLHGNILFVINRLDLIDEEDRKEVLEWASVALRGLGNPLVGEPRILLAGKGEPSGAWLAAFSGSELGQAVSVLSRASVLDHHLTRAVQLLQAERTRVRGRADEARLRHLESTMRERTAMRRALAEARGRLETVRAGIGALSPPFVAECVCDTMEQLRADPGRAQVRLQLASAVDNYVTRVNEEVGAALLGAPVTIPSFDLRDWVFRLDLDAGRDPMSAIGGTIGDLLTRPLDSGKSGRESGAVLGSWISKNVLGKDVAVETERKIERLAHAALTSIEAEVDRYLSRLFAILDEGTSFYQTWTRRSPEVDAAEEEERRWAALVQWCQGFERAVHRAVDEVLTAWPGGVSEQPGSDPC